MSGRKFKPGAFYWARPTWDVDFTPPGFDPSEFTDEAHAASREHWLQNEQPARFDGYGEDGEEHWIWLGIDEPREGGGIWWPPCRVGEEIVQ